MNKNYNILSTELSIYIDDIIFKREVNTIKNFIKNILFNKICIKDEFKSVTNFCNYFDLNTLDFRIYDGIFIQIYNMLSNFIQDNKNILQEVRNSLSYLNNANENINEEYLNFVIHIINIIFNSFRFKNDKSMKIVIYLLNILLDIITEKL